MNSSRKGFTLIELLIVVGIIGLLAIPAFELLTRRDRIQSYLAEEARVIARRIDAGESPCGLACYAKSLNGAYHCTIIGDDQQIFILWYYPYFGRDKDGTIVTRGNPHIGTLHFRNGEIFFAY